MSKGGVIAHIDGVSDEYVNALFMAGAVYLGWQLMKRAASPSTKPPVVGPPATTLPPPPGGHIDPIMPPPAAGAGSGPSLIYHAPPPASQRDYYGAGPSIAPAQWWDHGTGITQMWGGANALAAAAAAYAPPPPATFTKGPWKGVTVAERNAILNAKPKRAQGILPTSMTTDQMAADAARHGITKGRHY
jgi:hypothetical protein